MGFGRQPRRVVAAARLILKLDKFPGRVSGFVQIRRLSCGFTTVLQSSCSGWTAVRQRFDRSKTGFQRPANAACLPTSMICAERNFKRRVRRCRKHCFAAEILMRGSAPPAFQFWIAGQRILPSPKRHLWAQGTAGLSYIRLTMLRPSAAASLTAAADCTGQAVAARRACPRPLARCGRWCAWRRCGRARPD